MNGLTDEQAADMFRLLKIDEHSANGEYLKALIDMAYLRGELDYVRSQIVAKNEVGE